MCTVRRWGSLIKVTCRLEVWGRWRRCRGLGGSLAGRGKGVMVVRQDICAGDFRASKSCRKGASGREGRHISHSCMVQIGGRR